MVQRKTRDESEGSGDPAIDDLAAAADSIGTEGEGSPKPPGTDIVVAEAGPPTNEQLLAGALSAGRETFCLFTKFESPRVTLNDDVAKQLGNLWGPVLTKHGIDLNRYMGDYALEIAAAFGTFQIAAAVRSGVVAEMREREAKLAKEKEQSGETGGNDGALES